jgi:hypothetical protein
MIDLFTLMRITIRQLRKFIKEQIQRNMISMAGTISGGGASHSNNGSSPPGLGSEQIEDNTEKDDEKKQEKTQLGARIYDKHGGP